jgi:hypothetical protein
MTLYEVCELYFLWVLFLLMIRSYAHEREIFMKNASFSSWLYHFLICPRDLVGDACTQIVAILLIYVSLLACCSALCIFEKHMLALVDLIHALPTRGRKVPNSCFQGEFASRKEKLGDMHLFRGGLHSCIWELFFA